MINDDDNVFTGFLIVFEMIELVFFLLIIIVVLDFERLIELTVVKDSEDVLARAMDGSAK